MYYSTTYMSPLGLITLACEGGNICGLWLPEQKYHGGSIAAEMTQNDDAPIFAEAKSWLDRYFAGERPAASELSLTLAGSEFRVCIWSVLREIPYGGLASYGEIAEKAAAKMKRESMSCRAVGGAVGHNPISIIIPCHRVVGANGSLTGYAGGIAAKRRLLELEGVDISRLR